MSQDCKCYVVQNPAAGNQNFTYGIVHCNLHASAAQMREALEQIAGILDRTSGATPQMILKAARQVAQEALLSSRGDEARKASDCDHEYAPKYCHKCGSAKP